MRVRPQAPLGGAGLRLELLELGVVRRVPPIPPGQPSPPRASCPDGLWSRLPGIAPLHLEGDVEPFGEGDELRLGLGFPAARPTGSPSHL